jgi:hypothetical protein
MTSGRKHDREIDPLTDWEKTAVNLLTACRPDEKVDFEASRENMLTLMHALDGGELNAALADEGFMMVTETLLLAMLHGERIEVPNPNTYAARKKIFAAAQVIYNQAVARGLWKLHPEIRQAIEDRQ